MINNNTDDKASLHFSITEKRWEENIFNRLSKLCFSCHECIQRERREEKDHSTHSRRLLVKTNKTNIEKRRPQWSCSCPCILLRYLRYLDTYVEELTRLIPKPTGWHHRLVHSSFINSYSQIPSQFGLLSTKLAAMKQELFMQEKSLEQMLKPSSWIFRYWPDLRLKIKKQLRKFWEAY